MFNKFLLAAIAVGLGLNFAAQVVSIQARADANSCQEIATLTRDIAALDLKVDNMSAVVSHANDTVTSVSKKFDAMLYGSCQNRRICEFH